MPAPIVSHALFPLLIAVASADTANASADANVVAARAVVATATRAAGNARLPLYDDGCAERKGGCPVKP